MVNFSQQGVQVGTERHALNNVYDVALRLLGHHSAKAQVHPDALKPALAWTKDRVRPKRKYWA